MNARSLPGSPEHRTVRRHARRWCLLLVVSAGFAAPETVRGQAVDSTLLRPTDVVVAISGDVQGYDGVYRASGISRICGKLDLMMPHRANSFVVEFPDMEPNLQVTALSFNADTLRAGTTTSSFSLSVAVRTPSGGTPPAYVVRANQPQYGEPGSAQRVKAAGRDSLTIDGVATKGTKVRVRATVTCRPAP